MGLEAVCQCRVDDVSAEAKVLLEARELIVRKPFRRTIKIDEMADVEAVGDLLRFSHGASSVVLELGAAVAEKWARKISSPPPSLGQKLGIGHSSPVFVIGSVEDPMLVDVLDGHSADSGTAVMSLATVHTDRELRHVLAVHEAAMGKAPIWIVYAKGPAATFGETSVRQRMRAKGYRDTKVSAVSTELSAARFAPR